MTPRRLDEVSVEQSLPATTYRAAVEDAARVQLVDADLATALAAAAGMRNLLVHDHARIDLGLVAAAVPTARRDVRAFVRQVSAWLEARGG